MWSPKGFGFVAGDDGKDHFVHVTGLLDGEKELFVDDRVTFEIEFDPRKNKYQAVKVRLI